MWMKRQKQPIVKMILFMVITLLSGTVLHAQSTYHSDDLIPVARFGNLRAIGVGVSSTNRIFVSFPNRGGAYQYGLTEIVHGKTVPFPNEEWNKPGPADTHFTSLQDLFVDAKDNLWVLDSRPNPRGGDFKLIKINLANNTVEKIYTFDDLDKTKAGLNDVRVDTKRQLAYLSDPGQSAILVLDLKTGKTRIRLQKHPSTVADTSVMLTYDGKEMRDGNGRPFLSNVNGIALSKDDQYFYYKPINKLNLYRIQTKYLADASMPERELESKVEDMGITCITHGLEADQKGNIILSASTDYSIKYFSPDGKVHTLVQDSRILWPDSFGIGSDGYLYFSCAQLQRDPQWNNGENKVVLPYTLYKVKLP